MSNDRRFEEDVLRTAFGPANECPSLDDLEQVAAGVIATSTPLARHVQSCSYCQTELHLLQAFHAGGEGPASEEVRKVTSQLQAHSGEIFPKVSPTEPVPTPWWKAVFRVRSFAQASVGLAVVLLAIAAIITLRTSNNPSLKESSRIGEETFRTGNFNVVSPADDLQERPKEIRWEKVQKAATYQVRVLEVDGSEIWNTRTTEEHIDLPPSVRVRIVPARTLFCEINAFNSSGAKVGGTGLVRFRFAQDVNHH